MHDIDWNGVAEIRLSAQNSLVLVRSLLGDESIVLYEVIQPFLLKETKTFMEDTVSALSKIPMMVVAIGGVAIY